MGTRILSDPTPPPLGAGTGLEPAPTKKPSIFFFAGQVDIPLFLILFAFVLFGLLMVYSASSDYSLTWYDDPMFQFNRQIVFMLLGIFIATFTSFLNYKNIRYFVIAAMVVTIGFLIYVLFKDGVGRGISEGSYNPSEFAKVITIIYLSFWLHSKREQLHQVTWGILPLGGIIGLIGGMIFMQPDNSAALTIFILGGLLFFLGGAEWKQILVLFCLAVVVVIIMLKVSTNGQTRIEQFLVGLEDLTKASDHVTFSYQAIVNGGWFGVGIGKATTKLIGLPFAPTDSIFAVIAEELGLVGAAGTLFLYGMLVWRGLRIAAKAPDMLGSLLAAGLSLWIGIEALINILVMVGLAPFAGNVLPFISYGGSNLISTFIAAGLLLSVSRQGSQQALETEEWSALGANPDLRGRNRRRGVSSVGSS